MRVQQILFWAYYFVFGSFAFAQAKDSSQVKNVVPLKIEGYSEVYYCYDLNKPGDHLRPSFLYNHNRHNEVNVNLAFLKANYMDEKVRGNLALMAGTYAQYNLATEQSLLQHIYEANVGARLIKNVWMDAGVFSSHIGFESAASKDCWTLTRSLMAENSPYYECGARLTWTPNLKWQLSALYLNGWQRIQRIPGNNSPSFGALLNYKPTSKVSLSYSNFIGNVYPDSIARMRYFNNFYCTIQCNEQLSFLAGLDVGYEQAKKNSNQYYNWYSPAIIARYKLNEKICIAGRAEYFKDVHQVIVNVNNTNGFNVFGYSLNLDISPAKYMLFRIEGRTFKSSDAIFSYSGNRFTDQNIFFTTSMALSF